ncbi:hypothetical protein [Soonwooa purpurea]
MLFYKNCIKFEQSVILNEKTKVYEVLIFSSYGFYYFKNGNEVQKFATAYTSLIDEVIFNLELYTLKLNSIAPFLSPILKTKFSKENIFIESIYEVQYYIQQLKLTKVHSCKFWRVNMFVFQAIDLLLNICTSIDKRFINDLNQLYQSLLNLRLNFDTLLSYYQKGIENQQYTLNQASNFLKILENV